MTRIDFKKCSELLKANDNYLILTHRHPDGDTLGSAFALSRALRSIGKKTMVRCIDEMPEKYSFLWEDFSNSDIEYDKILAVDIADKKLLGEEFEKKYGGDVFVCVDHHMSHREYAENILLADRAATAEIVYELINEMGIAIDRKIADCIYVGLATDTGCFTFSNTAPSTHKIAAEMMEKGADFALINRLMFETKTLSYLKLEQMALATIESYFDGRCAVMTITQKMFRESGSNDGECDGIASLPRKIEGVKIGVTVRERTDGTYKVSLRTVEPYDASEICQKLGGGGHNRAAGCEFDCSLEEVKKILLKDIEAALV